MNALRRFWLRHTLRAIHTEIEGAEHARDALGHSIERLLTRERTVRGELFALENPHIQPYRPIPHARGRVALRSAMRKHKEQTQ